MKKIHLFVLSLVAAVMLLPACSAGSKLELAIAAASAECPMKVDEGVNVIDIVSEDNNLVYKFEIDEEVSEITLEDLANPTLKSLMEQGMKESFLSDSDEDERELIDLCREAKYGVIFRFIGKESGDHIDLKIDAEEL
jgi:hypothetical protein